MMRNLHEYAFDVTVMAALRVKARNQKEARAKLAALLDCASTNFGELDGQTMVAEASQVGRASLYEVDGEPYNDEPSLLDAMTSELKTCVANIREFAAECKNGEYTDTGVAWEIFNGMRRRMNRLLRQAAKVPR